LSFFYDSIFVLSTCFTASTSTTYDCSVATRKASTSFNGYKKLYQWSFRKV